MKLSDTSTGSSARSVTESLEAGQKQAGDTVEKEVIEVEQVEQVIEKPEENEIEIEETKKPDARPICKAFLEWDCKHGTTGEKLIMGRPCKDRHPVVCKRFLRLGTSKKGCTKDDCELFHPKLCKFVQTEACCHNSKCKLYHPFGFNKERKAAIKARTSKLAVTKAKPETNNQTAQKCSTVPNKETGDTFVRYQDFQRLEEVLIERIDAMDQPVNRFQVQAPPGHPIVPTWPPKNPIQNYSFMSQPVWC